MPTGCTSDALRFAAVALTLAASAVAARADDPKETPKEIIAVQIRKQGHPCDAPKTATLQPSTGNPDDKVWVLECGNASYRVRLTPDMGAHVERLK